MVTSSNVPSYLERDIFWNFVSNFDTPYVHIMISQFNLIKAVETSNFLQFNHIIKLMVNIIDKAKKK